MRILTDSLVRWERKEYGFGIPCRYPKPIGKYGITAGMSVPNNPRFGGIAWYGTQQAYLVCARPCQHFLCVHGRVNFFGVHGRASFFSCTAVPRFFPVRPCNLFSCTAVYPFSCTAVSQVCTHTQPSGFYNNNY